jgi:diguanylate cyclase (GGDEF)-like protein/PAS domain S-box-containing protein
MQTKDGAAESRQLDPSCLVFDASGHCRHAGVAAARMLGTTPAELEGQTVEGLRDRIAERGLAGHVDRRLDGGVHVAVRPGATASLGEGPFQRAFDCAPIGMALIDTTSGQLVEVNAALAAMLEYRVEVLQGTLYFQHLHPADLDPALTAATRLATGEVDHLVREARWVTGTGAVRHLRTTAASIEEGRAGRYVLAQMEDVTDLQATEAQLRAVVDALGEAVLLLHDDYSVEILNESARRLFDLPIGPRHVRLRDFTRRVIGEDGRDLHPTKFPPVLALDFDAPQINAVVGFLDHGGDVRWVSTNCHPVELRGRRTVVVSMTDVTASRQSEAHLRAVVDSIRDGLLVFDRDGVIVSANARAGEIFGMPAADLVGRDVGKEPPTYAADGTPIPAEQLPVHLTIETGVAQSGVPVSIPREGGVLRLRVNTAPLAVASDGAVEFVLATVTDVTPEQEAAEALRASEERLRLVAATSPTGIFGVAGDGRIVHANLRCAEITGLRGEPSLRAWFRAVHTDDRRRVRAGLRTVLGGQGELDIEFRMRRPDGSTAWVAVRATPVEDGPDGLAAVGSIQDVTDMATATAALARREAEYRLLAEHATDLISRHSADGTYLFASPACEALVGYTPDELIGINCFDRMHPDDVGEILDGLRRLMASDEVGAGTVEYRSRRKDGTWGWFETSVRAIRDEQGQLSELLAVTRDIDARKEVETELREAEERFRRAFEDGPIGMTLVAPDGAFLQSNRALSTILGRSDDELRATTVQALTHPEDVEVSASHMDALMAGRVSSYRLEKRYLRNDGTPVWCQLSVSLVRSSVDGTPLYTMSQIEDISDRRAIEERLSHQALHDALTGLSNRTLLLDRVRQAVARSARTGRAIAVLFIDLDRFKLVNDSLGHESGDELLVAVAERLLAVVRPDDTVARLGGDEFVVLCEDLGEEGIVAVAERLRASLAEPYALRGGEVSVRASIGIATPADGGSAAETLVRDADAAMYRAKERGRDRVVVFDDGMRGLAADRLSLEADLRRAIEGGDLSLAYQPTLDIRNGRITGMEALLRWEHPVRGVVPPSAFIPVAEETGLIVALGTWVLDQACRQVAAWRPLVGDAGLVMAVNLSARQLAHPGLVADVAEVLSRWGCRPGEICLEITESALMEDAEAARAQLTALKDLGLLLAVDDFGTGYSSLSYLKRFPVDLLKVDRSFVSGLGTDAEDSAIVTAVIGLAHALGLSALAEGVEDGTQLRELQRLGCDMAQGYLLARPQPAEEMVALLARDWRPAAWSGVPTA